MVGLGHIERAQSILKRLLEHDGLLQLSRPASLTGSLLQRLERDRKDPEQRFAFFMPTARGPCRFGVYNLLHKITLERLGWKDRVRIWSPSDAGYFNGVPRGFAALVFW